MKLDLTVDDLITIEKSLSNTIKKLQEEFDTAENDEEKQELAEIIAEKSQTLSKIRDAMEDIGLTTIDFD